MFTLPDWFGRYLVMVGAGGLFAVIFLYILTPGWLLKHTGTFPGMTANWISVERVPVTLLGYTLWITADGNLEQLFLGLMITVLGFAMDRLDGKVVRFVLTRLHFLTDHVVILNQGKPIGNIVFIKTTAPMTPDLRHFAWFEDKQTVVTRVPRKPGGRLKRKVRKTITTMRPVLLEDWIFRLIKPYTILPMFRLEKSEDPKYPGLMLSLTGWGAVIDAGADKICFLPIFADLAMRGYVEWAAAIAMIAVDLFGTVLRRPFSCWPGFRFLQRWVGEEKASSYGKTKFAFQLATLIVCMPASAGWLTPEGRHISYWVATVFLWLSVAMGGLSILSRLVFWQTISKKLGLARFNRRFQKFYEHDVA